MNLITRTSIVAYFAAFILASVTNVAWSSESHTIHQQDLKFSEIYIKIKPEDVLKFVNLDDVDHRLIFSHKGQQERMGTMEPGNSQEVTFIHSGIYDIQCIHHPEMKLTVFIPYVAKLISNASIYAF